MLPNIFVQMALLKLKSSFSIVCTAGRSQCSASEAVIRQLISEKYCSIFKSEVHVVTNFRLCTVSFHLFQIYKSSLNYNNGF